MQSLKHTVEGMTDTERHIFETMNGKNTLSPIRYVFILFAIFDFFEHF